ncbi:MAG TPA: VOC family protein [Sphingomicrobium sp.]|nr:VOC family protein [Sphingomicrobium sp.]
MTDVRTHDAPATEQSRTGPNPPGDFIWYELMTTDADGAKTFYDAVVGWNIGEGAPEFGGYRMIGRSDGGSAGGVLPITDEMAQHGARPMWLGYINVADVDAKVAAIEADGGRALMAPADIPGIGRIAMVADPQGAAFYVMKPIPPADKPNARSDVFSPDAVQRCAWNELVTTDLDAARRFYPEQFGWTLGDVMPMGPMGDYQFILQDGVMIGAMFAPPERQPAWRFCFRVDNLGRSVDAIRAGGGEILAGPMQLPDGGTIVQATDPQGAFFMLVERARQ